MPTDDISILKSLLKEYASAKSLSSTWIFNLSNMRKALTLQDVIDALDELLDEIEIDSGFNNFKESIHKWKQLLIDKQDVDVLFDLLID
jgi:hypothetical protein